MDAMARLRTQVGRGRDRFGDLGRELDNRIHHAPFNPKVSERLWIDPAQIRLATAWFPARSGLVVRQWPPSDLLPLERHPHVAYARAHWVEGLTWAETGALEYMDQQIAARGQQDGCRDRSDVLARFARLDEMYAAVKREGRLRTRQEIAPRAFREEGGILVHVSPDGELVSGDSGKHRLTIAQLHRLERIPVRLGQIHVAALPLLPRLRRPRPGTGVGNGDVL